MKFRKIDVFVTVKLHFHQHLIVFISTTLFLLSLLVTIINLFNTLTITIHFQENAPHLFFTIMINLLFLIICSFFCLTSSQQYYDSSICSTTTNSNGTRYTCSSSQNSCQTFVVYRANDQFTTFSAISLLFNMDTRSLLEVNNASNGNEVLETGHDVLVPVTCSCSGQYSEANITYILPPHMALSDVSCSVFEGLVKMITLIEENRHVSNGSVLHVPLKCACPGNHSDVKFFITYPLIQNDDITKIGEKLNVPVQDILAANNMAPGVPTVYPTTTVIVPMKDHPLINFNITPDPPTPHFLPTENLGETGRMSKIEKLYIAGGVVGSVLIVALLVACALYIKALRKFKSMKLVTHRISSMNSFSTPKSSPGPAGRSSTNNSCLSPDLLIGLKYSLSNYSFEELKQATHGFNGDSKISDTLYRGWIEHVEVMIKRIMVGETRHVIDVHSRINHVNIVKLNGVCYAEDDLSCSYLVFELPFNGSLRDCLSSSSAALHWHRRTQIAFDIATGLHYLHYSVIPAYTHLSLDSKNVFLTSTWRAKITVFGSVETLKERGREKVDIFAFGIVLLELISGKEALDAKMCREALKFLGGGVNEGGCFDQLRGCVDPCLKDDYPIAEALCLAVLAGSCIEDDPSHRPSSDDVLKILARMV